MNQNSKLSLLAFRVALAASAILISTSAFAQGEEAILQQMSTPETEPSFNGVNITQNGTSNEAYIRQVSHISSSAANTVQTGNENVIHLQQTGNHLTILVDQEGSDNFYQGDIEGEDARINIGQLGSGNLILQSLLLNISDISILQDGNGNEVQHTGASFGPGILIQQSGSGMKLIIESN